MKYSLPITMLIAVTSAWEVTYYIADSCRSSEIARRTYETTAADTCITEQLDNVVSAIVHDKEDTQSSISFYEGTACAGSALGVARSDECVTFPINGFGSVRLVGN